MKADGRFRTASVVASRDAPSVWRMRSTEERAQTIGRFFCERADLTTWRGHVRHLPVGEYWERLLVPVQPEAYQNGSYWAVPSGWVAQVMAIVDEEAARQLISDVLDVWRTDAVYECISPHVGHQVPGYVSSGINVLGAVCT